MNVDLATGSAYRLTLQRRHPEPASTVLVLEGSDSLAFDERLDPGFYTMDLHGLEGALGDFTMTLGTAYLNRPGGAFQGGAVVGGVMRDAAPSIGFAAFCIADEQTVSFQTAGANGPTGAAFGGSGVQNLMLRVLDRNGRTVFVTP
ncbi:MAG: hypothetical protein AAGE01_18540 [Pseudomonadota bacterium]